MIIVAGTSCAKARSSGAGGGDTSDVASTGSKVTGTMSHSASSTDVTTSSSTTGSGGSGGSSGSGGSGGACAESPCKLVDPQCGCPNGKACSINAMGSRVCVAEGPAMWNNACGAGNQCQAGTVCLSTPGAPGTCYKFCASDADCQAPGGLCVIGVNDANMMQIPNLTLCSANCDPIANTGCSQVPGLKCTIGQEQAGQMRDFSECIAAGAGTQGASCAKEQDCAAGYACLTTNGGASYNCYKYCNVIAPACGGIMNCSPITDANKKNLQIGNTQFGACL